MSPKNLESMTYDAKALEAACEAARREERERVLDIVRDVLTRDGQYEKGLPTLSREIQEEAER